MRRHVGDDNAGVAHSAIQVVAVGLAARGLLGIDEAGIPRRELEAHESAILHPTGDTTQGVEWWVVSRKLANEDPGSLDGAHGRFSPDCVVACRRATEWSGGMKEVRWHIDKRSPLGQ